MIRTLRMFKNFFSRDDVFGAFNANGDVNHGVPIVVSGYLKATADGTVNCEIFTKNCPIQCRVIDAVYHIRAKRTGGVPDHKLQLFKGDGAASEAFTAISSQDDIDAGAVDSNGRFATTTDAQIILEENKSLRAQLVVSGTTTGGTAEVEVHVTLVPVN